jgi:hypothetical protein
MGAVLFTTDGREPTEFHEEFTGTVSWMFPKENMSLTQDGKYYLVSYVPSGTEAKFWVALGEAEVFGLRDYIRMPLIIIEARRFHEVFPWGGILGWVYLGIMLLLLGVLGGFVIALRRSLRKLCTAPKNP